MAGYTEYGPRERKGIVSVRSLPVYPTGLYLVTTSASSYLLDFEQMVVQRFAGASYERTHFVSTLRKDSEEITLMNVIDCEVGESMHLMLIGLADGCATIRTTTPVQRIEAL